MIAPAGKPKEAPLLEQMRAVLRFKHYSIRTEQSYLDWVKRFILFHGKRHPRDMGADEVRVLPDPPGRGGQVAASTQNQALNALLFPLPVRCFNSTCPTSGRGTRPPAQEAAGRAHPPGSPQRCWMPSSNPPTR